MSSEKTTTEAASPSHIRLHITPLRPELLNTYLGPSLAPLATNISYHSVQNFPEKGFGYLELPAMEANKLKKKLNGSILKGQKIRIEDAKPEKRKRDAERVDGEGEDDSEEKPSKKTRRSKKSKASDKVIQGYELEDGRKIKRGWTETPAEKRQEKEAKKSKSKDKEKDKSDKKDKKDKKRKREASKYTNDPECLFRTTLPATAEPATTEKKSKKNKKKQDRDVVVHEFSNTKKHASFLKSATAVSDGKTTQEFVDGKGWVDADGEVLEGETEKQREKRERKERKERKRAEKAAAEAEREEAEKKAAEESAALAKKRKKVAKSKDVSSEEVENVAPVTSDSDTSSAVEDSSSAVEDSSSLEEDSSSAEEETTPTPAETPKEVHPLEALYKRPKLSALDTSPQTPKEPAFNFFGGGDDSDIEDTGDVFTRSDPQTPFTMQDIEWRGTRSAAPTPDTAAIGKRFSFSVMDDIDEDEEDSDEKEGKKLIARNTGMNGVVDALGITNSVQPEGAGKEEPQGDGEQREESDFAKWFFENRSENNKKWRTRRRDAMKMKRKRENRRLTRRIV